MIHTIQDDSAQDDKNTDLRKYRNYPIEIQLGYYLSSWGIIGTIVFVSIQLNFFVVAARGLKLKDLFISKFSTANLLWLISALIVGMVRSRVSCRVPKKYMLRPTPRPLR